MNEQQTPVIQEPTPIKQPRENILFGIIGAFLFSLVGGVLYYVLYQIGFFASISGVVGIVCAIKGYTFFSGAESKRGIVVSVITTVVVIMIAWYMCVSGDVYQAYQGWFEAGDVDYAPTYFECVRVAWLFIAEIPEYLLDLGLSILFAGLGCWGYVSNLLKRRKAAEAFRVRQAETQAKLDSQAEHAEQFADVEAHTEPDSTEDNGSDNE